MAVIWAWYTDMEKVETPCWAIAPLAENNGTSYVLTGDGRSPIGILREKKANNPEIHLAGKGSERKWILITPLKKMDVRVNGLPLLTGIRVLRDRDEIFFEGERLYFSTEQLARIEPFPGVENKAVCPRCQQLIAFQYSSVQCPLCHVYHHQSEDLPCWTYSNNCANTYCSQKTSLNAGYRWTPNNP